MATVKCLACGSANPPGERFCDACDSSIDLKVCAGCDTVNSPQASRCRSCGAPLGVKREQTIASEPPPVRPAAPPPIRADPSEARPSAEKRGRRGRSFSLTLIIVLALVGIAALGYQRGLPEGARDPLERLASVARRHVQALAPALAPASAPTGDPQPDPSPAPIADLAPKTAPQPGPIADSAPKPEPPPAPTISEPATDTPVTQSEPTYADTGDTRSATGQATAVFRIVTANARGIDHAIGVDLAKMVAPDAHIELEVKAASGSAEAITLLRFEPGVRLAIVNADVYRTFVEKAADSPQAARIIRPLRVVLPLYNPNSKEPFASASAETFLVTYDYDLQATVEDLVRFARSLCENFSTLQAQGHPQWKKVQLALPRLGKGLAYYEPTARELRSCLAARRAPERPTRACAGGDKILGFCN